MAAQVDLWGDIQASAVRTPVAILREQAALLGNKTQNLVEAKVESSVHLGNIHHSFELVVPTLDNYTYSLFVLQHGPELYPVIINDPFTHLENEKQFVEWLRQRLSSEQTKKIVGNLLAQATS